MIEESNLKNYFEDEQIKNLAQIKIFEKSDWTCEIPKLKCTKEELDDSI